MEGDALRGVRNAFFVGLYNEAIKECQALISAANSSYTVKSAAEVYHARCLVAINPQQYIQQHGQNDAQASLAVRAVKQLAIFLTTEADHQDMVVDTLRGWLKDPAFATNATLRVIAATVFMQLRNYKEALQLVQGDVENLEKLSMCVSIYLSINRLDLASKVVKIMSDLDDDDILTTLASSWILLATGGEKITEASFLYQELIEKFGPSVTVLNGLATCEIHLKNYTNAFQYLKQARDLAIENKQRVSSETLLNSIICLQHLRKGGEILAKIEGELKQNYGADHPYFKQQQELSSAFDRHAANYKFKPSK